MKQIFRIFYVAVLLLATRVSCDTFPSTTKKYGFLGPLGSDGPIRSTVFTEYLTAAKSTSTTKPPPSPQLISHCDQQFCYEISAQSQYYPDANTARSTCRNRNNSSWPVEIYESVMGSVNFILNNYRDVLSGMKIFLGLDRYEQKPWNWNNGKPFVEFKTKQEATTDDSRKAFIYITQPKSQTNSLEFYEDYSTNNRYFICQFKRRCEEFAYGWPGKGANSSTPNCYVACNNINNNNINNNNINNNINNYFMSWHEARYYCHKNGAGDLAVFDGHSIDDVIVGMASMATVAGQTYWVGAAKMRWYWNRDYPVKEALYTNWVYHAGFPNSNLFYLSSLSSSSSSYITYIEVSTDSDQWKDTTQGSTQNTMLDLTLICMSFNPMFNKMTSTTNHNEWMTTTAANDGSGMSKGSVVGVVIGLSIICSTISAIITYLVMKRCYEKKKNESLQHEHAIKKSPAS